MDRFPPDISTGIYYGWACVGNGDVHKMVLSIGWNPYYKNVKKSVVRSHNMVFLNVVCCCSILHGPPVRGTAGSNKQ